MVALARTRVEARRERSRQQWHFESGESNVMVDADRARLGRVLDNLLDNAVKYGSTEKPVEVRVGHECLDDRGWAVVQVQDHGIGIPAVDLPHVFQRYYRGANVASIAGEGLGLASAHQLIALHAGALEVQSEEGVGSIFTIRLPLMPKLTPMAVPALVGVATPGVAESDRGDVIPEA
jgi:signal transduction histidine kinase